MASYKSGFDPPTRPAETSRARRLGTYMQQNPGKQERLERRDEDVAHLTGQTNSRRPTAGPQQTMLPKSRMRDPSPSTRPKLEGTNTGRSSSSFGYNRNAPRTTAPAKPAPELRGKSSRNVLRRKPSSVAQEESRANGESQDSSSTKLSSVSSERKPSLETRTKSPEIHNDVFTRPPRTRTPAQPSPQIYPELDRYRFLPPPTSTKNNPPKISTQDLPPPTPLLSSSTPGYSAGSSHRRYSGYSSNGYSASPSTRFSESPGPGMYSRDTTPTSMSSQSPGIIASSKSLTTTPIMNTRLRQCSPAFNSNLSRPLMATRNRTGSFSLPAQVVEVEISQGLPSLRESLTSSSSNSTVKDGQVKEKEKKKKKRLSPMPPSPPPRKSSQKFKRSKSSETNELEDSPSKASSAPAKPVMVSPVQPSVQVARHAMNSRPGPPTRPSREGTPDLHAQMGIVPIVHSNLAHPPLQTQIQRRRQSSLPMPRSAGPSPQLRPTRPPARNNPSPGPILHSPREATPAPISGLGIIPTLPPPTSTSRNITRTPSPSISNTKSRFALFGRRTKTEPHGPPLTNENKNLRKGPAAGTGHEGYGKYSARGRSASAASTRQGSLGTSVTASSSTDSVATRDEFLLRRMSPVIIAGGGEIRENMNEEGDLIPTESGTTLLLDRGRPNLEKPLNHEASRTTLWPSALPHSPPQRISLTSKSRRPSDSSDSIISQSTHTRRSQLLTTANLPPPMRIGMGERTLSASTTDLSVLSDESQPEIAIARKGILTKPRKLEKKAQTQVKESSTKKWNFFHRSHSKGPAEQEVRHPTPVTVLVGRPANAQKVVPHYALLDSSDDQLAVEEVTLEGLLRDAEVVAMSNEELDLLQFGGKIPNAAREAAARVESRFKEAALAPSLPGPIQDLPEEPKPAHSAAPALFSSPEPLESRTPSERPRVHTPPMQTLFSSPAPLPSTPPTQQTTLHPQTSLHLNEPPARVRPSRLPQVGRIPKVISARPETTSPKSFSRPFARLSTLQPLVQPLLVDQASVALGPSPGTSPPKPLTPEPTMPLPSIPLTNPIVDPIQSQPGGREKGKTVEEIEARESTSSKSSSSMRFLAFSPRKGSEATSSSGGGMSFKDTTAVVPLPDDPLKEDEMWDEYDDLLSPRSPKVGMDIPVSATSSHGHPFQYEKFESRRQRTTRKSEVQASEGRVKDSPVLSSNPVLERKSRIDSSSVYSVDMSSRLKDALTTIPSPTTPLSFSEFFGGYGDRNLSVSAKSASQRISVASSSCHSEVSEEGTGLGLELSSSLMNSNLVTGQKADEQGRRRLTDRMVDLELRTGSMTVSKWLTFGHVLFSPAREDISRGNVGAKVLVIDGLGNDDWSFYASETYPSAHFYNLSPSHPPTTNPASPITSPPNHHQIHFPSSSSSDLRKLPFASQTFTTVVYRFPRLSSPLTYRHIITESKRVLKPGGYLELIVLDLDISSMGPLTRRAVRGLKVHLSSEGKEDVYLGSVGDLIGKQLAGTRGWEGVRSFVAGVPVASEVSMGKEKGKGKESSLSDLLRGGRDGADADVDGDQDRIGRDKDITKMVARVGRWWFGRCYESAASGARDGPQYPKHGPSRSQSETLFTNDILIECEEWRSSFKLFVGVARKASLSSSSTSSR